MINNAKKISVVIAAAGKGSRSGLNYPKCLFEIENKPIIIRLLQTLATWDSKPNIIVSNSGHNLIEKKLLQYNFDANFILQTNPLGMGNALLGLRNIVHHLSENILLAWGDLPFISEDTVSELVEHYFFESSDFSLVTAHSSNPYTIVMRDNLNNIQQVIETRESKAPISDKSSERDIGIFIFKRELVLDFLEKPAYNKFGDNSGEHGFLYILEHLVKAGFKVTSTETMQNIETISFNSPKDVEGYK
jgi:bifunctional UDP-N-acetylglucosamine pyrophosphorylase / glucosamine-1-phosphate N-acetyltransferase